MYCTVLILYSVSLARRTILETASRSGANFSVKTCPLILTVWILSRVLNIGCQHNFEHERRMTGYQWLASASMDASIMSCMQEDIHRFHLRQVLNSLHGRSRKDYILDKTY